MNLCWFCCHPGQNNLLPETVKDIDLNKTCEAHMDYVVLYRRDPGEMPTPMTPRLVLGAAAELERISMIMKNQQGGYLEMLPEVWK